MFILIALLQECRSKLGYLYKYYRNYIQYNQTTLYFFNNYKKEKATPSLYNINYVSRTNYINRLVQRYKIVLDLGSLELQQQLEGIRKLSDTQGPRRRSIEIGLQLLYKLLVLALDTLGIRLQYFRIEVCFKTYSYLDFLEDIL